MRRPRKPPGPVGRLFARLRPYVTAAAEWWVNLVARAEPVYSLPGPIFEKELRVAGRRARTYLLRLAYLGLLGAMVVLVWLTTVTMGAFFRGGFAYRMADAGKQLCTCIVWYLFCTAPLVSLVMLSTSISDELHRRTLGVLLTTPINSFQIVAGKLLGRLSQVVLLLGMSVPVMLVARLLGGVSWDFVVGGIAVTVTAALATGAVSMFFSIGTRRAVLVILKSVIALGAVWVLPPLAWPQAFEFSGAGGTGAWLVGHTNPFVALGRMTSGLHVHGAVAGGGGGAGFYWPVHCLMMLAFTAGLAGVCVVRVRQAALDQLMGLSGGWLGRTLRRWSRREAMPVRRVKRSPVVWHALRMRLGSVRPLAILGWVGGLAALSVTYVIAWRTGALGTVDVQMTYWLGLGAVGVLWTATLAATGIAREREAGTWPLLMATPLGEREIVAGKAIGVFRRCLAPWTLLAYHIVVCMVLGYLHPVVLVYFAVQVGGIAALLTGSGLLTGTFARRTWHAVALNLGFCIVFWALVPMMLGMVSGMAMCCMVPAFAPFLAYLCTHPIAQAVTLLRGAGGSGNAGLGLLELRFQWPLGIELGVVPTTLIVVVSMGLYVLLGWGMARWGAKRLRRHIF